MPLHEWQSDDRRSRRPRRPAESRPPARVRRPTVGSRPVEVKRARTGPSRGPRTRERSRPSCFLDLPSGPRTRSRAVMATPLATPAPADDAPVAAGGVREVARLAWPIVLTQMSQTVMHVVDSIFVGRLGAAELGALGFAGIWLWTVFSVFSGTATGVQTFVSQAWGAGDERACGRFAWQGLYALVPAAVAGGARLRARREAALGATRRDARGARARPRLRVDAAGGLRGTRDLDGVRLLLPRHRRYAHARSSLRSSRTS